MSAGWQVGDLALCVDDSPCMVSQSPSGLVRGKGYEVVGIEIVPEGFEDSGEVGLHIADDPLPASYSWAAERFRKIKPDTEPCEEEFTVLIKRGRKVDA